jgi:D-alanyl-D-alanine carboxypeptidase (penicillin-binding protein 5/6)
MKRSLALAVTLALALPLGAQEEGPGGEAKGAAVDRTGKGYTAALVLEPTTRRVLFEENADVALPTASMAKMMTLLIAMEEIRDGRLQLNTPVTISARASTMGGSQIYAKQGQVFPLQTLLAATMIQSANDAATAIAERIAGSAENFAGLMNDRARALGLRHTTYYDPHGLPNPKNPSQVNTMSARDLATLGLELMKFPLMEQYARMPTMPFSNGTFTAGLTNPNHLIQPGKRDYYPPANGIKTGYSGPAGFCVTASAEQGGMRLIAVVMGAPRSFGPQSSFGVASRLFSEAFARHVMVTVVKRGQRVGEAPVAGGSPKTVPAVAAADVKALVRRGQDRDLKVAFGARGAKAPLKAGQPVGTILVQQNGQTIAKATAIAEATVPEAPWWRKLWPF